ncbi:MAG: RluA family pseudouridine synthase [Patescibacteria group bacterium]
MIGKIRLYKAVIEQLRKQNKLEFTNPEVQRNIENFGVLVDDKLIKNRLHWLYPGQQISLTQWPQREHGDFSKIKALREDKDYILLFKPKGVVVQSGAGHQHHNLQSWLTQKYGREFFLVHRLDKDTQGLILVAKSLKSQVFFQNQFRNRTTSKKYLAVVEKTVDKLWIIENWQARDKTNPTKQKLFWTEKEATVYDSKKYKYAKSSIRPLVYCEELDQTLIEVKITTGRMHQIRLQCEAIGHPLVGDSIYNKSKQVSGKILQKLTKILPEVVINSSKSDFTDLKAEIFTEIDYCLLSNYISLMLPNNILLEAEYKKPPYHQE